jgi:8-oxo-dGTP pyrophosphatase MutT (NUDIX family)
MSAPAAPVQHAARLLQPRVGRWKQSSRSLTGFPVTRPTGVPASPSARGGYTAVMLIETREIFAGRVIKVSVDEVQLPNGLRIPLEIVRHPGGAAVVAIDSQDRVCLLRQFRHAAGGYIYELPAGKLEPDEPPETTARRELVEEASTSASHWESLGAYLSSPGCFTEVIHLYLATGLSETAGRADADEVFQVEWWPMDQALEKALNGELTDAKTIIGILRAASRKKIA